MTTNRAAEALAARRKAAAESGKTSKGRARNTEDQLVHSAERVHDENTDRLADDVSAVDRENEVTEWRRHSDLDAPPPRPGYVNRFIRIRLGTTRDSARLRQAMREGWRPVRASSAHGNSLPTINLDQFGDVIGVEDLVLCEMPEKLHKQRQKFYGEKQRRLNSGTERGDDLREISRNNAAGFGPIQQTRKTRIETRPPESVSPAGDDD